VKRVTQVMPFTQGLTPMQAYDLQKEALRHAMAAESVMREQDEDLSTIACSGAYLLGRAAYFAHQNADKKQRSHPNFRMLAHAMLAEALNDVELIMTKTEGRA
jgi:hypothetical protein